MTIMLSASAIILAGGQSRRMGRPKAALMFGNCTILERLIETLSGSFNDILIMAAPVQSEGFPIERLLRTAPPSVHLLHDRNAYQGAAVALAQGLAAAANDVAFACSCDLPLLRVEVVRALCEMLNGYEAVIPEIGSKLQPLCGVYRRDVARVIETQLASGERRLTHITATLRAYRPGELQLREIDPDLRSFMNVNTPEDYTRALALKQSPEPEN
jgi:molybdopterin-guanine dinucleotide biosynthesis protein A